MNRCVLSAFLNRLLVWQVDSNHLLAVLLYYANRQVLFKRHSDQPQSRKWHQGQIDDQGQFYLPTGEHVHYKDVRSVQVELPAWNGTPSFGEPTNDGEIVAPRFWELPLREEAKILTNELAGCWMRWGNDVCVVEAVIHTSPIAGEFIYPVAEEDDEIPFGNGLVLVGRDRPIPVGDIVGNEPLVNAGNPDIVPFRRSQEAFSLLR